MSNVIIGIVILVFIYIFVIYNILVSRKNKIKQATSTIDVYLTQRFDLIPNLVECVKAYAAHEKEMFIKITELREQYMINKNNKTAEEIEIQCEKIMLVAESYPELKASEHFLDLQKKLAKIENQLQAARRIYNMEINSYNNTVETFPSNFIANLFGFRKEEFFKAEEK